MGDVKIKVQADTTKTKTPPKARRRGRLMTDSSKISFRLDTTRNKPIYRPKITPFWRKDNDSKKER